MPFANRFMVDRTQKDKDDKHLIVTISEWQMGFLENCFKKQ